MTLDCTVRNISMFIYDNAMRNFRFSSVQFLDRLDRRGDMRDDSAEILFQSFLQVALVSSSGMGRDVHSLTLCFHGFTDTLHLCFLSFTVKKQKRRWTLSLRWISVVGLKATSKEYRSNVGLNVYGISAEWVHLLRFYIFWHVSKKCIFV